MYSRQWLFLIASLFILSSFSLFAQEPDPIEWGDIPMKDLKMSSFPADSNAAALILCDYGFISFNDAMDLVYTRNIRIKYFNERSYELASYIISLNKKEEYIDEIEGITYWLNEEGEILETELDEDDIKEEDYSDKIINHKFTMPGLKPGCITDVRYKVIIHNLAWVPDWTFQYSEPVRWSEYRLLHLPNFSYTAVTRGYEIFYISENTTVSKVVSGSAKSFASNDIAKCNMMRWVIKDAPAVREEPYMTCPDDYKNKVEIQLAVWSAPNHGVEKVTNNWPKFIEEMLESEWFGKKISHSGAVEDLALEITNGINDPLEKVKAIYFWVSRSIVWNGENRRSAERTMDEIIDLKKGNSAEINLLLLSLLKSAEIKCDPLLLSTRANGRIQDLYPIYTQFNYVVVRVNLNGSYIYMDATNPVRPYDILPSKVLNVKSIAIKEGPVEWDILKCSKKNITKSLAIINLDEEGNIKGTFENSFGEYASMNMRDDITKKDEIEVVKEILETEFYGFDIDSFAVSNKEKFGEPLKSNVYVNSNRYTQKNGDIIYLNPHLIYRLKENPLKAPVRKFPVDYGYKRGSSETIIINIPEGYEITELLKNKTILFGANSYSRKIIYEGNTLRIEKKFEINEVEIKSKQYNELVDFYSKILALESEQVAITKKASITDAKGI